MGLIFKNCFMRLSLNMLYVCTFMCMCAFICVYISTHTCAVFCSRWRLGKCKLNEYLLWVPSQTSVWNIKLTYIWAYLNQNLDVVFDPSFVISPMSVRKYCFICSQNSIPLAFNSLHLLCYHSTWNHYYLHVDFYNRIPAVFPASAFHQSPYNPFFTLPE